MYIDFIFLMRTLTYIRHIRNKIAFGISKVAKLGRLILTSAICRNSCLQMLFKICVLENFKNFIGKHLFWSLFLIKTLQNF